jgi:predicted phage terminase large subunit-like protein
MIPAEYEWRRHCVTSLGWHDPRGLDQKDEPLIAIQPDGARVPRDSAAQVELDQREGALMWPERFGPQEIARIKAELGPALSSGRLQQSPSPAKGGLFLREWWELYESPDGKFPPFEHVVASLDSAFTAKEQNDPSALTIWGVFSLPPTMVSRPPMGALPNSWAGEVRADKRQRVQEMPEGWSANVGKSREHRRIMLIHAWRKHLPFSGPRIEKIPGETSNMFKRRTSESWGLLEWVEDTCTRFKIDKLLIEAKASGISAAQELRNRYGFQGWSIETRPVRGDKVARALAVQPMFSQGMIYAPNRDWAELVMSEMAMFPAGRFDDLTDSATQALKYLRDRGWGQTDNEERQAEIGTVMHRPRLGRLYPC